MKLQVLALFVFLATNLCGMRSEQAPSTTTTKTGPPDTTTSRPHQNTTTSPSKSTMPTKKKTTTKLPAKEASTAPTSHTSDTSSKPAQKSYPTKIQELKTGKPAETMIPGKSKPTAHHSTVTTQKPIKMTCEMRNDSCSQCIGGDDCVYCGSDDSCSKKEGSVIPTGCKGNHWYWKQCKIPGNILIIVIPTVGGVLLIMLGCCIYCCCCRRRGSNRTTREETRQQQRRVDREERNAQRRHDRQARHDAIRMKYGLLQNMDDDESEALA